MSGPLAFVFFVVQGYSSLLSPGSLGSPALGDPLFSKMQGHWRGEGVRHSYLSNLANLASSDTPIQIQVESGLKGELFVSRNSVIEEKRTYVRVYWLRAKLGEPTNYEMGYGDDSNSGVSAVGIFSDNQFEVEQPLTSGLVLKSKTEFQSDRSLYSEKGYRGDALLFETNITFIRENLEQSGGQPRD